MFNKLFYIVMSVMTTGVALLLISFGIDVFAEYGITFSVVLHCVTVVAIMVFMVYTIYITWQQTVQVLRGHKVT